MLNGDKIVLLRKKLRTVYNEKVAHDRRIAKTPGESVKKFRSLVKKPRAEIPHDIQSWLCLYDECIAWSLSLWKFYSFAIDRSKAPESWEHSRVSCALLSGRLIQDLIATRDLIVAGFDNASKTVARSASETIDLLSLMHLDPKAAKEFRLVNNEEKANAFWYSYCSKAKIDKILHKRREVSIPDPDMREIFADWRKMYSSLISMSSHPSMPSVLGSFLDSNNLGGDEDSVLEGVLGQVSHMSRFTMHFLILRIHEFAKLFVSDYFSERSELFDWSQVDDEFSKKHLKDAVSVLSWIVGMTSLSENDDVFFPAFNTYWRPIIKFK